jgi:hypothetical protein
MAFVMSVQLIGFGMAGVLRRFLVKPMAMFWPSILSQVALYVGFHEKEDDKSKFRLSRFQFFWIFVGVFFVYTWIPQFFITVLQSVALLCFVTQNSWARFFGSSTPLRGMGIGAISFDWYYIGGAQLTTPFYASVQYAVSNM